MPEPESELAREGCGQTSVCRQVVAGLPPGRSKVCSMALSAGSVLATCQAIDWELGRAPECTRATAFRALQTEITRLATEARQQPLLVLNEAQHLRPEVLEDLRLLAHFALDFAPRLGLLLAGLTEWQRRLAMAVPTSLNQRIVVRQHRAGLVRAELGESMHSTACGWPAASCRCWSRLRWRRCTRPRTACRGRSTGWRTPRWPPPSMSNAPPGS